MTSLNLINRLDSYAAAVYSSLSADPLIPLSTFDLREIYFGPIKGLFLSEGLKQGLGTKGSFYSAKEAQEEFESSHRIDLNLLENLSEPDQFELQLYLNQLLKSLELTPESFNQLSIGEKVTLMRGNP